MPTEQNKLEYLRGSKEFNCHFFQVKYVNKIKIEKDSKKEQKLVEQNESMLKIMQLQAEFRINSKIEDFKITVLFER